MAKDLMTCPNCGVDVDREELRQLKLCCPTCGFDLSERDVEDDAWDSDTIEFRDEEDGFGRRGPGSKGR